MGSRDIRKNASNPHAGIAGFDRSAKLPLFEQEATSPEALTLASMQSSSNVEKHERNMQSALAKAQEYLAGVICSHANRVAKDLIKAPKGSQQAALASILPGYFLALPSPEQVRMLRASFARAYKEDPPRNVSISLAQISILSEHLQQLQEGRVGDFLRTVAERALKTRFPLTLEEAEEWQKKPSRRGVYSSPGCLHEILGSLTRAFSRSLETLGVKEAVTFLRIYDPRPQPPGLPIDDASRFFREMRDRFFPKYQKLEESLESIRGFRTHIVDAFVSDLRTANLH